MIDGMTDKCLNIFSVKCDLVLVSCDTITNIDLFTMLNHFRQNKASIVTQMFKCGLDADTIVPGPKAKHKQGKEKMLINLSLLPLMILNFFFSFTHRSRFDWYSSGHTTFGLPRIG